LLKISEKLAVVPVASPANTVTEGYRTIPNAVSPIVSVNIAAIALIFDFNTITSPLYFHYYQGLCPDTLTICKF